jgi:Helix-turn-helix domain
MPAPLVVSLRPEQMRELRHLRDHDPTPYVREKAAAILKVAAGHSVRAVARAGLLRPRRRETVASWVRRYLADGAAGLRVRPGRGRKPAFFPPVGGGRGGRAA